MVIPRLLDVVAAADRVGVSERTIRRWATDGLIFAAGYVGARVYNWEMEVLKAERATRGHAPYRQPRTWVA